MSLKQWKLIDYSEIRQNSYDNKFLRKKIKILNKHIYFNTKQNKGTLPNLNKIIENKEKTTLKLLKKIIAFFLIIIIFFYTLGFTNLSYANIEDNEEINLEEIQESVETSANVSTEPNLDARIALVYDRTSENVLYEKNGYKTTPMASTTKIMTSIVVLEKANLNDIVTVDKKAAATGGSRLGLKTGDKLTVNDLLYGLMLRSGNDAAVALAIHVGGSVEGFATLMNQKANELGLKNTNFVTPHGLDNEKHYTTAYELAKMADYALKKEKFKQIVATQNCNITINEVSKSITNTNELLGYLNGVYGIKTGFTNGAGRCLVTGCKRGSLDIITVVLGADTKKIRTADSIKLIEYIYNNYEIVNIKQTVEEKFNDWININQDRIYVNKGITSKMQLCMGEMKYEAMAIKKQSKDKINIEINAIFYFQAPVEEKRVIGNLKVIIDNKEVEIINIYNKNEIKKKQAKDYIKEFLYNIKYF